jgi:hypothetical protein
MKTWLSIGAGLRTTGLLAALTMIGSLAWTGCGPADDRYYCDDGGCYTCDGYRCTNVKPPTPQACTSNQSCGVGSICAESGCVKTCKTEGSTSECDRGTVCKSGLCVAPGGDAGTTKECTTSAECGDGKVCTANKCVAATATDAGVDAKPVCAGGPCACTTASDCANGDQCAGGVCTKPVNTCKFGSECETGKSCVNGQCVASCVDASTCGAGFTCTKGVCQPQPSSQCAGDGQCAAPTPKCVAGACVAACTTDPECGAGKYCNNGACATDTRPKTICSATDSSACGTNQSCVNGFCKYTCSTDQGCKLIDARIGYCGVDKVCRTQAEAVPQCTKQADCTTAGQFCIDNVCK